MPVVRFRNGKYELRVKDKLLPKIFTATFLDEAEARSYGQQLKAMLQNGIIPAELQAARSTASSDTLAKLIDDYRQTVSTSALDKDILDMLRIQPKGIATTRVGEVITYAWAERWVRAMKLKQNLAPGTIRKRVGAVARMLDWHITRSTEPGRQPLANPLRMLPARYSIYNEFEREQLHALEKDAKHDSTRDRRLLDGEEARILAALRGERREGRERPLELPEGEALHDLYLLMVNSALRLREAFLLHTKDVNLSHWTIHVRGSKTGVARDVPMVPCVREVLLRRIGGLRRQGPYVPIFPWWRGQKDGRELDRVTELLSRALIRAFQYAGCEDLRGHDLRHEATCRWILMRDAEGRWLYRMEEAMKITGHKDPKMFMRYVSLRGSDLAERLWIKLP